MADGGALTDEMARTFGVNARHERMNNGELRFRLMAADGTGYIRTVASESGGWQNSHYHNSVLETYIVQHGWVAFVELQGGDLTWRLLRPGDVHTTTTRVAHNLYLPGNGVIHTVKHGNNTQNLDWHASHDLDLRTKSISEDELKHDLGV